ncbi:MAG: hypothetical protein ACRC2T_18865 [Thermoguttaceae bacterium]
MLKNSDANGHRQNLPKLISPELVDTIIKFELITCHDCGQKLDFQIANINITVSVFTLPPP